MKQTDYKNSGKKKQRNL